MSGASKSQIAFARAILRFVGYGMALNGVVAAWAIWAFVIGMPDAWFEPSMWAALAVWVGGELILVLTILVPASRARAADQDSEKGLR
jgi:uncharacterized protein (DUF983 family)